MFTYLLINILTASIPVAYSFHKRLNFYHAWTAFWPAVFLTSAFFISWDIIFTNLGVWGFNQKYLLGATLLGLPFEEWFFFLCIPYACVFTYHCLKRLIKRDYLAKQANNISWFLILGLLGLAALNIEQLYTSITFVLTAGFLLLHLTVFRFNYLGRFYFAYSILLLPFLLVNGILTGSFIAEPVVWYNDAENLGIRVFTIPVEDFIYGLLLVLMNVTIYEALLSKRIGSQNEK